MTFVVPVRKEKRQLLGAVTHVDGSARIQTVTNQSNPRYYKLLKAFEAKTNYGVLVNTSFNVRGEPIVCAPADAYRCFMRTEMDALVLETFVLHKADQAAPASSERGVGRGGGPGRVSASAVARCVVYASRRRGLRPRARTRSRARSWRVGTRRPRASSQTGMLTPRVVSVPAGCSPARAGPPAPAREP